MTIRHAAIATLALATFALGACASGNSADPLGRAPAARPGVVRIGTYDSRAVALAWARSASHQRMIAAMASEAADSRRGGNIPRAEEIEQQLKQRQFMLHAVTFSNAPPTEALRSLQPHLEEVARKHGLVAIVDALDYRAQDIQTVDLTETLVDRFEPTAETRKLAHEMRNRRVIDLYQATQHPH